ncbi:MAG: FadR family transcriptional regulator [Rhodobacteraceae bacterium]|nr:FadR family transcriptional regulator [Paracoccaceae bacterium]
MLFERVQSEKLAQSVVRQIELMILRGVLSPGMRLPSERELSERMGVSRPSLREAVAELEKNGLLTSKPGSGIYVSKQLEAEFPASLSRLFSVHDEAVDDVIAFRRDMEGLAIERAAALGSDTDLAVIDTIFKKMEAAHDAGKTAEESALDAEFHMAIIEASHNVVMLHMMRSMYGLLQDGVFFNRKVMFQQRMTRDMLLDQHRAMNEGLQARDPAAARAAAESHLDFVAEAMSLQRKADKNEAVARQRYARELGKA